MPIKISFTKKNDTDYIIPPEKRDEYMRAREAADSNQKEGKTYNNAFLLAKGTNVSGDLANGINVAIAKVSGVKTY